MDNLNSAGEMLVTHNSVESVAKEGDKSVTFLGRKVKGISGSTIKFIAIIAMLYDHTAAVLMEPILFNIYNAQYSNLGNSSYPEIFNSNFYKIYEAMRSFGRLGFPIFCFLLVEGFLYTRSKRKYLIRLGLFSILSEIPFDLAANGFHFGSGKFKLFEITSQNVFFTLFIGMCVIIAIDKILHTEKIKHRVVRYMITFFIIAAGMTAANILRTDYSAFGVLTIIIMYFLRKDKNAEMYGGCMTLTFMSLGEAYAFLNVIPIALYNGTRGLKLKYFFYLFYPVHLLILAGIARLWGIC